MMMTPAERYREDPFFHSLVSMLYHEFERCDSGGAGLTPTEVRQAAAFAWQIYCERHAHPLLVRSPDQEPPDYGAQAGRR
jgi:hypothetical protein